jgi:hypothetical protein
VSTRSIRRRLLWGAILVIAVAFTVTFLHRLAFTDLILARGDTFAYFYPYWGARDAALRAGLLPLWSPDLFMGVPLLANSQLGTFYPPNWLTISISPPDAVRVSVLLHVAWAFLGAYALARRTLGVGVWAGVIGGAAFAFGGYLGGRVEQINQLQGLSWLPWALVLFAATIRTEHHRGLRIGLLGVVLALQFLSGHTQTVFITGVGLALYMVSVPHAPSERAYVRAIFRRIGMLGTAGALALILALPQLLPTLELTSVSNRRGGLTPNQATAFSFSPFAAGRGLLPNYDTPIFGEYSASFGVIGIGLALIGVWAAFSRVSAGRSTLRARFNALIRAPIFPYLVLMVIGLALAFGLYNPIYWMLASLPGFNWFRVPARWLALFALGGALLTAAGVQAWITFALARGSRRWIALIVVMIVGVLAAGAWFLSARNPDGTPLTPPDIRTLIGWGAALFAFVAALWIVRDSRLIALLLVVELFAAAQFQPFNDLVPRSTYTGMRFTAAQLGVYADDARAADLPPGRMLSISETLFDPGDRAALEAHYRARGMSDAAIRIALTDIKLAEVLAPNLPLTWGIPSIDGFDGGVLPTAYYTAFTSLMLPEGELRTVDGRLRESLAVESCGGACIPDLRWLHMTDTRYLVVDKVFDVWRAGVAYDTALPAIPTMDSPVRYTNVQRFEADTIDLVYTCEISRCTLPTIPNAVLTAYEPLERYQWARYALPDARVLPEIVVTGGSMTVRAVTLVDSRTTDDPRGIDFQQLAPQPFTRVLSSDIKIYENSATLPRAFIVYAARVFPDTDLGTEMALDAMRDPAFDPLQTVILNHDNPAWANYAESRGAGRAEIVRYDDTAIRIRVESDRAGWLVLMDSYYPGWIGDFYGQPSGYSVLRANAMFRAIPISAGTYEVGMVYHGGAGAQVGVVIGGAAWITLIVGVCGALVVRRLHDS